MKEVIFLIFLILLFLFFLYYGHREGKKLNRTQRRLKDKIKDHYR